MLYLKPHGGPAAQGMHLPEAAYYLDAAEMLMHLRAQGRTLAEMAQFTGMTAQQAADRLSLMGLDEGLRGYLRRESVPEKSAMALLKLPDALTRRRVAAKIVRERLCVRDAVLLVGAAGRRCAAMREEKRRSQRVITLIRDVRPYHNALRDIAGQMQKAGWQADYSERRIGGRMELVIAYPCRRRRTERYQPM